MSISVIPLLQHSVPYLNVTLNDIGDLFDTRLRSYHIFSNKNYAKFIIFHLSGTGLKYTLLTISKYSVSAI